MAHVVGELCGCIDCRTAMDRASAMVCKQLDDDECPIAMLAMAEAYKYAASYVAMAGLGIGPFELLEQDRGIGTVFVEWSIANLQNGLGSTYPGIGEAMQRHLDRKKEEAKLPKGT